MFAPITDWMEMEAKDEDARLPVHLTSARRPEVFVPAVANANVGASDFRMQKNAGLESQKTQK